MQKRFAITLLFASLIAVWSVKGYGQDAAPSTEIFIGGTKLWEHTIGGPYHNHGPEFAITGNFNRFVGLEMQLSKFQDFPPVAPAFGDYYRLLFGPHFAYNGNSRGSPFAHVLLGLTGGRQCPPTSPCNLGSEEVPGSAFTTAIGGGVDVKVFHILWIRPLQADYVRVFFHNAPENNLQLSFGFTLRFGRLRRR